MQLVADESVEKSVVIELRSLGAKVIYIAEINAGIPDDEVLKLANTSNSILLTADKDFGELVFRFSLPTKGIIFYRLPNINREEKATFLSKLIVNNFSKLANRFSVITKEGIRIKKLN